MDLLGFVPKRAYVSAFQPSLDAKKWIRVKALVTGIYQENIPVCAMQLLLFAFKSRDWSEMLGEKIMFDSNSGIPEPNSSAF